MRRRYQRVLLFVLTGFIVTLMTAAPVAAQAPMMGAICVLNNPTPFPATSFAVSYINSVVCSSPITNIDLSVELYVMPEGSQTWEFVDGATSNRPPIQVSASPYRSANSAQATTPPSQPCKNGMYVGRATATAQLNDWFDRETVTSAPVRITGCPTSTPLPNPLPPPDPLPPPPQRTIDQVADSIKNKPLNSAIIEITSAGFSLGDITRERSATVPVDHVIKANRINGITLDLVVSLGRLAFRENSFLPCSTPSVTASLPLCSALVDTACTSENLTQTCKVPLDLVNCDPEPGPNSPAKTTHRRTVICSP